MKKSHYNLFFETTKLGRINSGNIISWSGKLWLVLNPVVDESGKLIRSLVGENHESKILNLDEKVDLLVKIKTSQKSNKETS